MNKIIEIIMCILNAALFSNENQKISIGSDCEKLRSELKRHSVFTLISNVINFFDIGDSVKKEWSREISKKAAINIYISNYEKNLVKLFKSKGINCVILKGAAYAQYYPEPHLRARGDIDILIKENDLPYASNLMKEEGFSLLESGKRHLTFKKDFVEVELHKFFSMVDFGSQYFSVDKVVESFFFPPAENGILMLLHIKHHIDDIGLRHFMDWVMYVKNVCDDEFWNKKLVFDAKKYEVYELACSLTRIAKRFFPLNVSWCGASSKRLDRDIWDSIKSTGDFSSSTTVRKMITATSTESNPKVIIGIIKKNAIKNHPIVQKVKFLLPLFFIVQSLAFLKNYLNKSGNSIFKTIKIIRRDKRLKRYKAKYSLKDYQW